MFGVSGSQNHARKTAVRGGSEVEKEDNFFFGPGGCHFCSKISGSGRKVFVRENVHVFV